MPINSTICCFKNLMCYMLCKCVIIRQWEKQVKMELRFDPLINYSFCEIK